MFFSKSCLYLCNKKQSKMKLEGIMEKILESLKQERYELQQLDKKLEKALSKKVEGALGCVKKGNAVQYYHITKENGSEKRKYIKKRDIKLAEKIAQYDYDEKIHKVIRKRLNRLEILINDYNRHDLYDIYDEIIDARKKLIKPVVISDKEFVKEWEDVDYPTHNKYDFPIEIYTEKGEQVRSKSEKIIADKLYMKNIPYRYEYPLELENGFTIYPDFMILNVGTRNVIYLEHLGMMDDYEYMMLAMKKIENYEKNGYLLGKDLVLTHETSQRPLDVRVVDNIIDTFFK